MKVCVQGLWHLGSVTAACLASIGHDVVGFDPDVARIDALSAGHPPILEPGLEELVRAGLASGRLHFTSQREAALQGAEALWVTMDTPVDDDDRADTAYVIGEIETMLPLLPHDGVVVVSSQLPVGSIAALEAFAAARLPRHRLAFACVPENLRLGKAIDVFRNPDRIVAGVRNAESRTRVEPLIRSISERVEWMGVESAEMTKHAINAFLAISVTFANELATVCEGVGADAKDVERGLKSESRIGPRAYLAPGAAFAGGTLARDIAFLGELADRQGVQVPLLAAVRPSNQAHRGWIARKLRLLQPELRGARVAIWGLTYKPGTDTLRRSSAIELCRQLVDAGATVVVHDPAVKALPDDLAARVELAPTPLQAAQGASMLAVCTEWPEYRDVPPQGLADAAPGVQVVDPGRFLAHLAKAPGVGYHAVGTPGG